MELRHLRYFVAVAHALSFTHAAKSLGLAQSSLTRQIRDLESEMGVQLFNRARGRIALTHEGEFFLLDAEKIVRDCAASIIAVQHVARERNSYLKIGYERFTSHPVVPKSLQFFCGKSPATEISVFEMTPAEQLKALQEGGIDIGFVGFRPPVENRELRWTVAGRYGMTAAIPERHSLAAKEIVMLSDLDGVFFVGMSEGTHPGASAWLIEKCREAGVTTRVLQKVSRPSDMITFVAEGFGVALLPEQPRELCCQGVVLRPVEENIRAELYAVWNTENPSSAVRKYLEIIREHQVLGGERPCDAWAVSKGAQATGQIVPMIRS